MKEGLKTISLVVTDEEFMEFEKAVIQLSQDEGRIVKKSEVMKRLLDKFLECKKKDLKVKENTV